MTFPLSLERKCITGSEKRKAQFAGAKSQFFSLFGEKDAYKRGKALERALKGKGKAVKPTTVAALKRDLGLG